MQLEVGNTLVRILGQSHYCRLRDPTKFLTCSTNTELMRLTGLNKKKCWSTGIPLNPSPNHDRERLYFACSLAFLHHMDQIITDKEMEALCNKCGKKSDLFEDPWLPSTARSELIWPEVPSPYFLEFTWCISTATPDVFYQILANFADKHRPHYDKIAKIADLYSWLLFCLMISGPTVIFLVDE